MVFPGDKFIDRSLQFAPGTPRIISDRLPSVPCWLLAQGCFDCGLAEIKTWKE